MSTWDSMNDVDYQACVDAGRGEPPDPREIVDDARKTARERGEVCPVHRSPLRGVFTMRNGAYYVDLVCDECGQTIVLDREGGT